MAASERQIWRCCLETGGSVSDADAREQRPCRGVCIAAYGAPREAGRRRNASPRGPKGGAPRGVIQQDRAGGLHDAAIQLAASRAGTMEDLDTHHVHATGCRVGEIASTSLDCQAPNYLDLRSASLRITEAKYNSQGIVPIDVTNICILRWYVRQVRPQLKNALHLRHLFLSKTGRPDSANVLTQMFSLLLDRLGFAEKTCHSFRHYYVTDLLRKGVQPHVVPPLARHRDARTTLQIYAHPTIEDLKMAVNRRLVQ